MNAKLRNTLAIAGLMSIMTISVVSAESGVDLPEGVTITDTGRVITLVDWEQNDGLSNINTVGNTNGGAISSGGANLTILGGTFENNVLTSVTAAVFGGAIAQNGGLLTIKDGVIFRGNTVTSPTQTYEGWNGEDTASGGAIYLTGANAVIGNVQFINNYSRNNTPDGASNGGAIFMQSAPSVKMGDVIFTGNSTRIRGGAIYNGDSILTMGKATFTGNQAARGGAIYMYESGNPLTPDTIVTTGAESKFDSNIATENGGAIANFDAVLNIGEGNTFTGNKAETGLGGAIYNSNFVGTSVANIAGGTSFTNNVAQKGGAIYNSGEVTLTSAQEKDITFSGNIATEAKGGASVYLDGAGSKLLIDGADGKVSFQDNGAIAGVGAITKTNDGTIEFVNNKDVSGFTGKYTQSGGTIILDNSAMFNNYEITAGGMQLVNGATATIDGNQRKFSGDSLTISDTNSLLTLSSTIDRSVQVNLLAGGKINIQNATLTLNSAPAARIATYAGGTLGDGDTWEGDIVNSTAKSSLVLDGFNHSTASGGGNFTQTNGSLTLKNGSALTLGNAGSSVSGGSVSVQANSTLAVGGGSSITGGTTTIQKDGSLNIQDGGSVTGGNTTVQQNGSMNIQSGGSVTGGNTTVQQNGSMNIQSGGAVTGGTTTIEKNGSVTVYDGGSISGNANTTIKSGATLNVAGGSLDATTGTGKTNIQSGGNLVISDNGSVKLDSNDTWAGKITNNKSTLTLSGVIHDTINGGYEQNSGTLNLEDNSSLTLGNKGSISDGTVNVTGSTLVVGSGGKIEGGSVSVDNGATFTVQEGGSVTGGEVEFTGSGVTAQISGNILAGAIFDVTEGNKVVINSPANVTLDGATGTADEWTGTVQLNGGTLNFLGSADGTNGGLLGDSGTLNVSGGDQHLTIAAGSYIKDTVRTTVAEASSLDVAGGDVEFNNNTVWNGKVDVSAGNLSLNNVTKGANAVLTQTTGSGTTTLTGDSFVLNNAADEISAGTLKIGTDSASGLLTQNNGSIKSSADVYINGNSTLDIKGGETTLDSGDTWLGTVKVSNGDLTLSGIKNDNGKLLASGGSVAINNASTLLVADGSKIEKGADVVLAADSAVNVQDNGLVEFDKPTEWLGTVNLKDGGVLNYSTTQNGLLVADDGELNTITDSILNIATGSYIEEAVDATINGQLNISGTNAENFGYVTLSSGDTLLGNTNINNYGVLNLYDNVKMADSGQTITFQSANSVMNLETNNKLDLKAELVGVNGQINKNGAGDVEFSGGTSNYKGNLLVNNSGDLTFVDEGGFGGNLQFGNVEGQHIGIIADKIQGAIKQTVDAQITYSTYRDINLNFDDQVDVLKGALVAKTHNGKDANFNSNVNVGNNASLIVHSGRNVNFNAPVDITGKPNSERPLLALYGSTVNVPDLDAENSLVYTNAKASVFGDISLIDSNLQIAQNGFSSENLLLSGHSGVQLMNGVITDNNIDKMTVDDAAVADFSVDISPRDWTSDKILAGSITTNGIGGTLNINDFQFINKCPIDRHVPLRIFDTATPGYENLVFAATNKEIRTPIGYYGLFPTGNGNYNASLTRYVPEVFRGQVATMSTWQNQLTVNNLLFDHVQQINMQYLAQSNPNKYASLYPQFAPYQYNKKDGSLWFKPFGVIEKLNMTQGLNVNNTFYGALIGADFPAVEMKKGWTMLPTAYIGYTGSHQSYDGVGMYQNGGQAGAMATFMKNDFIGSIMAFGGGYNNRMDVGNATDNTGNWVVGTAAKAAYNFHPTKHFVIQPSVLASYTYLGQQNWHSNYGDMSMRAEMLNGVNVAPGVNFIYGRETWSLYATVQYFYNVLGYTGGLAGNDVDLPHLRMRHGFLQYGIGATKTWKDRFSGFLQIVIRNGGRTGIGFMGGITFKF